MGAAHLALTAPSEEIEMSLPYDYVVAVGQDIESGRPVPGMYDEVPGEFGMVMAPVMARHPDAERMLAALAAARSALSPWMPADLRRSVLGEVVDAPTSAMRIPQHAGDVDLIKTIS